MDQIGSNKIKLDQKTKSVYNLNDCNVWLLFSSISKWKLFHVRFFANKINAKFLKYVQPLISNSGSLILVLFQTPKCVKMIVASSSTCYYSENQIFCFLESQILTWRNYFFRNKTFLFVVQMSWNFQHLIILGFHGCSQNLS